MMDAERHALTSAGRAHVRAANRDIDKHISNRLRQRRVMLGLTQQQMADLVGTSYQQQHKYETGINRISAAQLFRQAGALNVPITYFFDGLSDDDKPGSIPHDLLLLGLAQNFKGIRKQRHREMVADLARALFQSQDAPDA